MSLEDYSSNGLKSICENCIGNEEYLKSVVRQSASHEICDYCQSQTKTIGFEKAYELVCNGLVEYSRAVDELPYNGREGGYLGSTYETHEVVEDLELEAQDEFLRDIISELGEHELWCDTDWNQMNDSDVLKYSWSRFAEIVKHKERFVFLDYDKRTQLKYIDPDTPLPIDHLLKMICEWIVEFKLFSTIRKDVEVYRGRQTNGGESFVTPEELGTPPKEIAIATRMTPAGIPCFYASSDIKTAAAEILEDTQTSARISLGTWQTQKDMRLVDLTKLPQLPSIFKLEDREKRGKLIFLYHFKDEVLKPVNKNGQEHIGYIPTQVVSEYIRIMLPKMEKCQIDGIAYPSERSPGGDCYALFHEAPTRSQSYPTKSEVLRLIDSKDLLISKKPDIVI